MFPVEFSHARLAEHFTTESVDPEYRVNLALTVADAAALWSAAAAKAMQAPGMTIEDVLDTLGAREAPDVAGCLAMLILPLALPGCRTDDLWVGSAPVLPATCGRSVLDVSERQAA